MKEIIKLLPEIEGEEAIYISHTTSGMDEEELKSFAHIYRTRRRDPQHVLFGTLLGLFVVAGVQRFMTGQIGMGILYLLTFGLCLAGTIVDLVNYRQMANDYNQKMARESAAMVDMMFSTRQSGSGSIDL